MYEAYLRELLAPLGVYDFSKGSVSGAELYALGMKLDGVGARLDAVERESLTVTAEDEGLRRREALFARRPAAVTPPERLAPDCRGQPDAGGYQPDYAGLRHTGESAGDGKRAASGDFSRDGGGSGGVRAD